MSVTERDTNINLGSVPRDKLSTDYEAVLNIPSDMIKNGILSYPTVPLSSSLDWVLQSQLKNIQVADIKPYVPSLSDTITELRKSLPLNNTLARQEFNDEIAKIKNNALDFTVTLANGMPTSELPEEYYRKIACDVESAIELAKKDQ